MADQIVLAWTVDVKNTIFSPAQAAGALASVPLYQNRGTDPVLGQFFGLTVAADDTSTSGTTATRALTLNMTSANSPTAPPPFPCNPRTSVPPEPPYPLLRATPLPGSFFVSNGATVIPTTSSQIPSLVTTDPTTGVPTIQFLSQQGVFYRIAAVGASSITLSSPYTGVSGNTEAFQEIGAPATITAVYSSSDLDTAGVATDPAIPAGSGALTVSLQYVDSLGNAGTTAVALTGRRPAGITLEGGTIDIASITGFSIGEVGAFGNNVGQITLVELSSPLPPIPSNATPGTGIGAGQGTNTFVALTDEAQGLIARPIAYLPPSYFTLAQQGVSEPQLSGSFLVSTGSTNVFTENDQTSKLAAGHLVEFAEQPGTLYAVATVSPKLLILATAYTGIDTNNTGANNVNSNIGTKGNIGTSVNRKPSTATLVVPSPATAPSTAQLSGPIGEIMPNGQTAAPPFSPPLMPVTVPAPTFLSGYFGRSLQLALAGVPVVSQTITFV